ncbi:MAG: hypothetical protein A2X80_03645 [Geobacteraceae bacterium GWB2_52_12]|nr:MAG: hypothetical protein A2X80_03645 [Geobacteraceae bacterium GWB2_52_12]
MNYAPWNRVLITGGAGAIGSNLSNALSDAGCTVTVLDDLSSGSTGLLNEEINFIHGSVCRDQDLENAFSSSPDVVFHLAALFANQNSVEHPRKDIDVNGLGTIKVLEFAKKNHIKKLLYTSSSCIYGSNPDMRENNYIGCTDTPYAITKLLGEQYCRFWSRHHNLDTVIVRLFNSYGPGEFPGPYRNVIPNFFSLALQGEPLPITGSGDEIRDFNFVDDTVNGIISAMSSTTLPGDVYNLASGIGTRISDLACMINEITGNRAGIRFVPRRTWDSITTRIGCIEKARKEIAYKPSCNLTRGLSRTHEWFKLHGIK